MPSGPEALEGSREQRASKTSSSVISMLFNVALGVGREDIVIVVSPLISLTQDKVRGMIERNVTAVYIGGADDMLEAAYGMDDITSNGGETHPATCPLYRKHRLPPASKVAKQTH